MIILSANRYNNGVKFEINTHYRSEHEARMMKEHNVSILGTWGQIEPDEYLKFVRGVGTTFWGSVDLVCLFDGVTMKYRDLIDLANVQLLLK